MLSLADSLLPNRLLLFVDSILKPGNNMFLGGLHGTQCLDISTAAHLVVEKGLDIKSQAAIAQADMEKYYYHLNPVAIARYLISRGCDVSLACSCVKAQMLPSVTLAVLGGVCGV